MTDLVIVPSSVIAGTDSNITLGSAGATVTAGQVVYKDATDKRFKLADNNHATPAVRVPVGIALHGASAGQPLAILESGSITIGGAMTPNTAYYLSDSPGGICPVADLGSGEYPALLGMATSATVLVVKIQVPGGAL